MRPLEKTKIITNVDLDAYNWSDFLKRDETAIQGLVPAKNQPFVNHFWRLLKRQHLTQFGFEDLSMDGSAADVFLMPKQFASCEVLSQAPVLILRAADHISGFPGPDAVEVPKPISSMDMQQFERTATKCLEATFSLPNAALWLRSLAKPPLVNLPNLSWWPAPAPNLMLDPVWEASQFRPGMPREITAGPKAKATAKAAPKPQLRCKAAPKPNVACKAAPKPKLACKAAPRPKLAPKLLPKARPSAAPKVAPRANATFGRSKCRWAVNGCGKCRAQT